MFVVLIMFYHQISVVLSAVLGTILYRITLVSVIYGGGGFFVKEHAKLFTSVTAALDLGVMTEAEAKRRDNRRCFMENLIKEGLEVELEDKSQSFNEKTFFLKIHLPWRLETRLAEVMNLKLPVKRFITISVKPSWVSQSKVLLLLEL